MGYNGRVKKLLVRAPQWLGDAVVSTVFLDRLKKHYPDASISVLCPAPLSAVYETHPSVDSVLVFRYGGGDTLWSVARRIRAESFDAAFILPRSFRTALEARLAGIPRRIGFAGDLRRWLLTESVPYNPRLLYAHRYLKLIGEEGAPAANLKAHFPKAQLTEEEATHLAGTTAPFHEPLLGLAPASIAPSRTWPAERFAEVANHFLERNGGTVFIFGSPQEKGTTLRVKKMIRGHAIDTAGRLDLPQLGFFLSRLSFLVANDSGLMHAAAVFGVPTVVIFGASDPTFAVPPWGRVTALQHPEIPCVPCLRNTCVRFGPYHRECLTTVTTDEAFAAIGRAQKC